MANQSKQDKLHDKASGLLRRGCALILPIAMLGASALVWPAEINSVHLDRTGGKFVVLGSGFDLSTTVTLGGISVPTTLISSSELEIPYGPGVYSAIQWEASYRLVINGTGTMSVYVDAPIYAPSPPGGPDCPCIADWTTSGIPKDNFSWCYYGLDGNQSWFYAPRDNWVISTAFDPTNIFFDPVNPGNSISYCVLTDNGSYSVAEPVVNAEQYLDCENWLWINICI